VTVRVTEPVDAKDGGVMKLRKAILWIFVISLLLTLRTGDCSSRQEDTGRAELYNQIQLFSDAIALIQSNYVDQIDPKTLIYGALGGMLRALDPYSQFMDPDTYNEMKVETVGKFGGLGIEISIRDNLLTIIAPIDGTPAHKVGLKAGDKIVKIDGEPTRDITLIGAVKKLRGKPGTNVDLTVLREKEKKLLDFTITRDIIKITSVKQAKILEEDIGYIRLVEFQEGTEKELETALKELEGKGISSLILDLRDNPGGLLNTAVSVMDKFMEAGRPIVTTKGRKETQVIEFKSRRKNAYREYPLVVIVNGGSASASEIVAGAVQDNNRGLVIGTKTFGKGSVQTVVPLADGSALRITTAKYFTPSGRSIVNDGIVPDILVEQKEYTVSAEAAAEDIFRHLDEKDFQKAMEEDVVPYDHQLSTAINIIKGIVAYRYKGIDG
jgi:carboxyl-terminal processing protease